MPVSPHFALPTLLGQLQGAGIDATVMDLNIDFYNKILTKNYVEKSLDMAKKIHPLLKRNIQQYFDKNKKFKDYTFPQQNEIAKASMIDNTLKKYGDSLSSIPLIIDKSVEVIKSKEHYYNPKLFLSAINNIKKALEICSMPYYPTKLDYTSYSNELLSLDLKQ